jgi:hypothetical protein
MSNGNGHIRFTEPYSPQHDDFQPIPVSMDIEFVDVCTGPPYSVGDTVEMQRRKQLERNRQATAEIAELFMQVEQTIQAEQLAQPAQIETTFAELVLSIIEPSRELIEYSRGFTHLTISSERNVPMPYIRAKIPMIYKDVYLDETTATHTLHLTSVNGMTAEIPIHDLVLVAQCLETRRLVKLQSNRRKQENVKPVLFVENVPHLESFGILLRWLYSNNEDELYEGLRRSRDNGDDIVLGFAQNCRFWGMIDARVLGVVRTIVEDPRQI